MKVNGCDNWRQEYERAAGGFIFPWEEDLCHTDHWTIKLLQNQLLASFPGEEKPGRWIHAAALYNICLTAFVHFHSVKIRMNCILPHLSETLWATYLTIFDNRKNTIKAENWTEHATMMTHTYQVCVCHRRVEVFSCLSPFAFCVIEGHNDQHVTTQLLLFLLICNPLDF